MGHYLHRAECRSWIYAWHCPDCTHPVFVYQCTCGSGLFFEHNAPPWPLHDCERAQHAAFMKGNGAWLKEGMDPSTGKGNPFWQLQNFQAHDKAAPAAVAATSQPPGAPPATKFDTKAMDPMPGEVETFIGVVRALSAKTAKLASLYEGLGDMGRKHLGLPAQSKAIQITIERNEDDPVESFTCVATLAETKAVHVGQLVWATIEARQASTTSIWLVTGLHVL